MSSDIRPTDDDLSRDLRADLSELEGRHGRDFEAWARDNADHAWPAAIRRALAAEAEVGRLRRLIERDRTGLAAALARVRRTVAGWAWLAAPGEWGCYEYGQRTVATLRGEIGRCLAEIETEAIDALRSSGSLVSDAFHGPKPAEPAAGDGVQVTDDDGEAD